MANCRPNIPNFTLPECINETGRIVAISFIHKAIHAAIYADPSNAALWVDANYAADLHVFQEARGTYSGGQPTDIPGFGTQATRVINAEHTATIMIEGVRDNEGFWDNIALSHEYRFAFVVGGNYDLLMINNKDISVYSTPVIEDGLDSEVAWNATVKWRDFYNMKTSAVPSGIFS